MQPDSGGVTTCSWPQPTYEDVGVYCIGVSYLGLTFTLLYPYLAIPGSSNSEESCAFSSVKTSHKVAKLLVGRSAGISLHVARAEPGDARFAQESGTASSPKTSHAVDDKSTSFLVFSCSRGLFAQLSFLVHQLSIVVLLFLHDCPVPTWVLLVSRHPWCVCPTPPPDHRRLHPSASPEEYSDDDRR